jgi:hypothetical protein
MIPATLRPFFQEYDFGKLDPERSAFTIIERTLAWGDRAELRWLFARYGRQRLAEWVRQAGWRCLPRRRFLFSGSATFNSTILRAEKGYGRISRTALESRTR